MLCWSDNIVERGVMLTNNVSTFLASTAHSPKYGRRNGIYEASTSIQSEEVHTFSNELASAEKRKSNAPLPRLYMYLLKNFKTELMSRAPHRRACFFSGFQKILY
jgi:hypothetical protein